MDIKTAKQKVSLLEYVASHYTIDNSSKRYSFVNPCPVCGHANHLSVNGKMNLFSSFSGCCKGGSILDWFMQVEGLSFKQASSKLLALAEGNTFILDEDTLRIDSTASENASIDDHTEYINNLYKKTRRDPNLFKARNDFCKSRGIELSQIVTNKISAIHWTSNGHSYIRIVLPVWKDGKCVWFTRRAYNAPDSEIRFMNVAGVPKEKAIFNSDILKKDSLKSIFLTESITDALNLEAIGFDVIALNSTNNLDAFIELYNASNARKTPLVACFDNDKAGLEAKAKIIALGHHAMTIPTVKTKVDSNGLTTDSTDFNDYYLYRIEQRKKGKMHKISKKCINNLIG